MVVLSKVFPEMGECRGFPPEKGDAIRERHIGVTPQGHARRKYADTETNS